MATSTEPADESDPSPAQAVRQLGAIPVWLAAALDVDRVMLALNRHVPEFASGALTLRGCAIDMLHLKDTDGEWSRNWKLTVADADGERQVPVRVTLFAPGTATLTPPTPLPFDSGDWQCWLPELGLLFKRGRAKKSKDFASLALLMDGEQARQVLEQALRAQAPGYDQVAIRSCAPAMVHNKPGKSTVIRYTLGYGPEAAGRGWRDTMIVKVYGDDTGRNAFDGMRAVWDAGLHSSEAVAIPEPLAYLAELQATVQGPVPEQHDLEKLLLALLMSDDPAEQETLRQAFGDTGAALAAFHRSGGRVNTTTTWHEGFAEAAEQLNCLRVPFPAPTAALDRLAGQLRALEAATPADPPVPTHGAFRPEQILLAGQGIGFIDFDAFCMAEPAFDLALFRASAMDNGLYDEHIRPGDQAEAAARRARIDQLNEIFLAAYEAHTPVSRQRVGLWEAIFYFNDSLQCWTKPRPNDPRLVVGLLERQLNALGIVKKPAQSRPGESRVNSAPDSQTVRREPGISEGLARLATLPGWLLAPLQADRVAAALQTAVPEFASGELTLKSCKIKRMLLKADGRWAGTYTLNISDASGDKRALALRGTFTPPHLRAPEDTAPAAPVVPLGAEGWQLALPALGLDLAPEPPETELIAMPQLTDPEAARAMLEQGIRECTYPDMRIAACRPEVLSYKPGSRCTLRYHLSYPPELAGRGWPATVIGKTYRKDSKGRNAYEGMLALWHTPLASGSVVGLAEPLAYIPAHKVMLQGPVRGDQSLEDMLKAALAANTPEAYAELHSYMIRAAAALAALHRSGVRHGAAVTLAERWAELHELSARLAAGAPELAGAAEPLLARLEALAAASPDGAAVPTHGTFNPEQVLIDGPHVGIIDFDDFSMAEPALDVGLFIAAIKDIGMNALSPEQSRDLGVRRERLARLDAIGEIFLTFYEKLAPIERERVALWQAWSYFRDALHFWIKVKPAEPDNGMLMLVDQLQRMGVLAAPEEQVAAAATKARRRASIPAARYAAYASALLSGLAVKADDLAELLGAVLPLIG